MAAPRELNDGERRRLPLAMGIGEEDVELLDSGWGDMPR